MRQMQGRKVFPWRWLLRWSLILCLLVPVLLFAQRVGITCPIKYLTGISCPGCGMTRACVSALRLDFAAAFFYHPLWVMLPPIAVLGPLLYVKKSKKAFWLLIGIFVAAMLAVYLWRLLFSSGDVVVFAPATGRIGRLFMYLKKLLLRIIT
jgi:hypothetical protein